MKHLKSIEEFKSINENVSGDKAKNFQVVVNAMKKHGITNQYTQKAILATISKECGFIPKSEKGYGDTENSIIETKFADKIKEYENKNKVKVDIESIKKNDKEFFDMLYGGKRDNDSPGDGYKYRGRGFNQITYKRGYKKYNDLINKENKLGRTVDLINNQDQLNDVDVAAEAAILYFKSNVQSDAMQRKYGTKDINSFKDQNTALRAIVNINAGLGKDINGSSHLRSATKALSRITISPTGVYNIS